MKMTPPPATPACAGSPPEWFDIWDEPGLALSVCAECPVRQWCLNTVDPLRSHFDGVAGGHAWHEGEHRGGDLFDAELQLYISRVNPRHRSAGIIDATRIDHTAVRSFLEGKLPWHLLNQDERVMAAKHLIDSGKMSTSKAALHCHLNYQKLRSELSLTKR
jgi:hypothetical protein